MLKLEHEVRRSLSWGEVPAAPEPLKRQRKLMGKKSHPLNYGLFSIPFRYVVCAAHVCVWVWATVSFHVEVSGCQESSSVMVYLLRLGLLLNLKQAVWPASSRDPHISVQLRAYMALTWKLRI